MVLLLLGVQGAWADEVTYIERSWDATGNKVVDTQRTIAAKGGLEGAGIGGENRGKGGKLFVYDGDVTASGGCEGAGIGGGFGGEGAEVHISGGKVDAEGGYDGAYYDLQGRKLEGKPARSGLYIHNGRKVVIK